MTELWEWTESDLQALVDQQAEESLELEFKSCDSLQKKDKNKAEVSKDVSAFANSAGGTIVYGIKETKKHTATALDDGYDPGDIGKEWLEQVINSRIQPRIPGVRIRPVQLDSHNAGKVAYVVSVPQSATAHQASDKKYYKRFNFESVPMEDYEIRDVMQRVSAPDVSIVAAVDDSISGRFDFTGPVGGVFTSPLITLCASNADQAGVCEYSQYQVLVPSEVKCTAHVLIGDNIVGGRARTEPRPSSSRIVGDGGQIDLSLLEINWPPNAMPLFPGEERHVADFAIRIPNDSRFCEVYPMLWRSRPARGRVQTGVVVLQQQAGTRWGFQPMTVEELEDKYDWIIRFAP